MIKPMSRLRWIFPLLTVILVPMVLISTVVVYGEWSGRDGKLDRELGFVLPAAVEYTHSDSHGGFHGDGLRMDIRQYSQEVGDEIEAAIRSRGDLWNSGPFDDYLGGVVYAGGHGAKEAGWPRYPENAYWFFKDRHSQQEKVLDERNSWNYTAALFDADTDTLYYIEFDT